MFTYHNYYHGKKVLITGGMGFLGSNLAIALVGLGAKVALMDAMLPLYGGNSFNVREIKEKVDFHCADIRDEGAVNYLVKGKDVIFHIGNQTSHVESMNDPLLDIDINCRGNMVFLEACRKCNPEARIIYAGTRGQYGKAHYIPVDEVHPTCPTDIYGINKHAAEQYFLLYSNYYEMNTISLRINNTFGPRHQMKHSGYGILNWFIRLAMDGETIKIFGDGSQLRDYNYIDDVTEAFLLAGESSAGFGEAYNLGSGRQISLKEIVEAVIKEVGKGKYTNIPWPQERKKIETGDFAADFAKFKKLTGWEPKIPFEEGLKRTVAFYKEYRDYYW
jgi:nucleoside-diphosphate-sugar epimerase